MKTFLVGLLTVITALILVALVYTAAGVIFYLGLPVLGVDITYSQAIVLVVLIAVTGSMFRGGSGSASTSKGED